MDFEELIDVIVFAPDYTSEIYTDGPKALAPEQVIDAFQKAYWMWILSFAEKLDSMQDSGFALLGILNAYPEMIAQLQGVTGTKPELFTYGMLEVFPELKNKDDVEKICHHLYSHLRSSIAHMGLTGANIFLNCDIEFPIISGNYKGAFAIVLNPHLWFMRICEHFSNYISDLRDPEEKELRKKFWKRMQHPF
jgi:hypothetical protein